MPESASFSVRRKPNYRRRRTFVVLGVIVAVVVVLLLLPRGGGGPGRKTPTLTFAATMQNVAQETIPDVGTKRKNFNDVVKIFNDFYQTAFVDPKKWGDGQFKDLRDLFAKDVQPSFTKDLDSLTIGPARTELSFVDLGTSKLVVTVYYDKSKRPTLAVAAAEFTARGTLKKAGSGPLNIRQKASFYLQKTGNGWIITAYDADQTQQTPTPSPSPSASR